MLLSFVVWLAVSVVAGVALGACLSILGNEDVQPTRNAHATRVWDLRTGRSTLLVSDPEDTRLVTRFSANQYKLKTLEIERAMSSVARSWRNARNWSPRSRV